MKYIKTQVTKILFTDLANLDTVSVFLEDFEKGKGKITITCFGKAWTAYWGGMSKFTISEFFCTCDQHYIAKNMSTIKSEIFDINAIRDEAEKKGVNCYRDDPWNDHEFMEKMYGPDMENWCDRIPSRTNPEYEYLCRIIRTVQIGLDNISEEDQKEIFRIGA